MSILIGKKRGLFKRGAVFDVDAQAFIATAGLTDDTQKSAINSLTVDLKGYGIWDKLIALYPFVGGTASTHKWNLKDPRDLDAAFRLTFDGATAPTHASTGVKATGVNCYANTHITPTTDMIDSIKGHIATYIRDLDVSASFNDLEIGPVGITPNGQHFYLAIKYGPFFGGGKEFIANIGSTGADASLQVGAGFYGVSRLDANNLEKYLDGVELDSFSKTSIGHADTKIGILGSPSSNEWSLKEMALTSFGDGLTTTEWANFYTAVQAYQTTLSRQV